ncbi:MAG TPA: hypothetical protein DEA90_11605, partial [Opitutae bacterium]|nr:hypothetical protein [Opitutae bacterium]
ASSVHPIESNPQHNGAVHPFRYGCRTSQFQAWAGRSTGQLGAKTGFGNGLRPTGKLRQRQASGKRIGRTS